MRELGRRRASRSGPEAEQPIQLLGELVIKRKYGLPLDPATRHQRMELPFSLSEADTDPAAVRERERLDAQLHYHVREAVDVMPWATDAVVEKALRSLPVRRPARIRPVRKGATLQEIMEMK